MREQGEVDVLFMQSEKNSSDIFTKNVPEKLLNTHATNIRNGRLECQEEWEELVGLLEVKDESIHHVQWEDVGMWIDQQTVDDRLSELSMTV